MQAFAELQHASGLPPTYRELCSVLGIRSTNAIAEVLRALERKGYARQAGGELSSRGWLLTPRGLDLLGLLPTQPGQICPHCGHEVPP